LVEFGVGVGVVGGLVVVVVGGGVGVLVVVGGGVVFLIVEGGGVGALVVVVGGGVGVLVVVGGGVVAGTIGPFGGVIFLHSASVTHTAPFSKLHAPSRSLEQ
jgi:hypothetical protein